MEQITVIKRNGEIINLFSKDPICFVKSATQNSTLMGDDNVSLSFVSSQIISFGKGDKIMVDGEEYTIRTKVTREIVSENQINYDAVFYGVMYDLMKTLFRDCDANGRSTRSTFDLTCTIKEYVQIIIYNLNRDYPGIWAFDESNCPDTEPISIAFSKQNCLQVLQLLCSTNNFKLEFRITQKDGVRTIHIGKFGQKVVPPGGNEYFEYGKGNGLYKLKEQKVDDKTIITRLWVEGGTNNIRSGYRNYSDRLQLPYPKRLNRNDHTLADGTIVKAGTEMIGIDDDNKRYLEDAVLRDALGSDEDAEQYEEIYPKRTGVVTALVSEDLCSFIDSTMDFDLNEKDENGTKYLIADTAAKITFISGKLAGQEFELESKDGYVHLTKTFKIKSVTDERGLTIPTSDTEAFRISIGDKYKITSINLPDSYVDNAEEDLWYQSNDDFKPRTQAQAQYSLTLDRSYFVENLPSDSDICYFHCGDYVPVKDTRYGIEKNIRINKVSRNLLTDHDYTITLSDSTSVTVVSQTVVAVQEHERVIETNRLRDLNKARRGWRTTEELRNMVYDTDGYFDVDNIKPNSIDTNMLTVGSKSQQFVLIDVVLQANVNGLPNRFDCTSGTLAHLSINDSEIARWNLSAASFTMSESSGYYLFAKCSKKSNNGIWYLTQEQMKVEPVEDPNNYYFQIGIIGSLRSDDNFRDFVTTYGFTRINGNTITTGKIITSDKQCYLDLDGNAFRIGDSASSIDWNVSAKDTLTLHNVRLLSDSGDTSNIGVFRGAYNSGYVYYYGDEVSYTSGSKTCTYRYTNPEPSKGYLPTNSTYWAIVASGEDGTQGEDGKSIFYTYNDSNEQPATPTGGGTTGGWHTASTATIVWMSIKSAKTITDGSWGTPFRVKGADGTSIMIKGSKESISQLPTTGNVSGDCYIIGEYLYVWDGTNWINVGKIKGENGQSSYLHIKYSNDGGTTFTPGNGETPGTWIGILVNTNSVDSDNPTDYSWNNTKGEQGTPGEPGEDGRTTYLHIKYSDNGGLSFTGNNGEDSGSYIGQYTDFELNDSNDPTMYKWSIIKGDSGTSGADSASGEYYEYRYAKNGSTTSPPDLDTATSAPDGWSTQMPTVGSLEYIWCTMAKKCGVTEKTRVHIPIGNAEQLEDTSGNGYNGSIGSGSIVTSSGRTYLDLSSSAEARIPYDLPFGQSFTLSLWLKTSERYFRWIINGYYGREYKDGEVNISANTWYHYAFRFNDRTITIFQNGIQIAIASVNESLVGFALYDDNIFGSSFCVDDIRIMMGALAADDIQKLYNGTVDSLIQNWSTPIRVNPFDGKDGADAVSIDDVDVEYAISTSNSTAPTSGWQTTSPTWVDGKYIWSRTKVTYSDKSSTTSNPVCITGAKGGTGGTGVGVSSIVEQYYQSTSYSSLSGGTWSTVRPTAKEGWYIWTRSVITYTNGTSTTTSPISVTGDKGDTGPKGDSPVLVYRGIYDSTKTYYGNSNRIDGVKYNGVYYVARVDAGEFSNKLPTNTAQWNTFGAQFETVATNLLLADGANIAGFIYESSNNDETGTMRSQTYKNGRPKISLNGSTGKAELQDLKAYGSLATPPMSLDDNSSGVNLSFESGFNFAGKLTSASSKNIKLPIDIEYDGVECSIINYGGSGYYNITTADNKSFLYSGTTKSKNTINSIRLYSCSRLTLKAIKVYDVIRWFVMNQNDFSFDYVNLCLTNNISLPMMRCIGVYYIDYLGRLQEIQCSDGNHITGTYNNKWRTFTFQKKRDANKQYVVMLDGNYTYKVRIPKYLDRFEIYVTDPNAEGGTSEWVDIIDMRFYIYEFDL